MDHNDDHHHSHCRPGHSHVPKNFGAAFAIGTTLNLAFVILEVVFGIYAHSLALVADAGHNLGDVLGLVLAWIASVLARTPPTQRHTYGLRGSSILAALFNALLLLVSVGAIAWEAMRRFNVPTDVSGNTVVWVSAVGILINTATALMFMSGRKGDLNIRGAFLHMAADAAISAGVVVAGFAILATGYHWIDPAVSLAISVIIIWGTWDLLRESVNMAMHAVPESVDPSAVKKYLTSLDGVTAVHDLHIWAMSTTETALTVHLVKPEPEIDDKLIADICDKLHRDFGIDHSTIQLERGSLAHPCKQASDHTV